MGLNDPRFQNHVANFGAAHDGRTPRNAREFLDWLAESRDPLTADVWQDEAAELFGEPSLPAD